MKTSYHKVTIADTQQRVKEFHQISVARSNAYLQ